jgi:hypothetical protein
VTTLSNRTWLAASQICSSLSNVLVVFVAAALLPTSDLGAIGLAFSAFLIAVAVVRGLIGEPALLNFAIGSNSREIAGGALIVGCLSSLVLVVPVLAIDVNHREVLAFSVFVTPLLCVQDALRYAAFAQERPRDAAISDLVWVMGSLVAIAVSYATHGISVNRLLTGWCIAGVLATATIARCMLEQRSSVHDWLRSGWSSLFVWRRLRFGLSLESIATSGVIQIAALQVTHFGGLTAGGIARVVQTAHGPL